MKINDEGRLTPKNSTVTICVNMNSKQHPDVKINDEGRLTLKNSTAITICVNVSSKHSIQTRKLIMRAD